MNFPFVLPTRIVMEPGLRSKVGGYLQELEIGRVLIVTDPGIEAAGLLAPIYSSLEDAGIGFQITTDVKPNPRSDDCNRVAREHKGSAIEGIVAVGGGSAIDAAKAIAVLMTHDGIIEDYEGENTLSNDPLPLVAIPTTAGTGSEVTFFSVITDPARQYKMSLLDVRLAPELALLDTEVTAQLPPAIAAATGMDALTHAIEAYTGKMANPISDGLALHAIRLISANLIPAVEERNNQSAREQMMVASLIAGMAFGNADIASVHCISEAIGGMYDTPHGVANSIFLPFVFRHNCDADLERHAQVAFALGIDPGLSHEDAANAAVDLLFSMSQRLGIPKFSEVPGVKEVDFQSIAEKSQQNISNASNAKEMTVDSYLEIIRQAYNH
ncbi:MULTISPECIES: iron-containing alcohol dehydrogenase [unclassified Modicisalibacter]|uniref:iron-containing alcohol dehydrogenase n=1 Tax=unclassified Modicisalibacter TaxID=2679913 RepID=UPI001CCD8550|nr:MULTISPECIES: iron-containing alcohol dehydrogenase [unclassified Modicisalibacter]MBZ9558029.1 iron-containing alcohol dehydrogenase [Modicisalibacter sp. R2A 31.J]MBZ9573303.1 iron-containing alcohol dehydrogenase [Modicisalibacter sp. MOD 31.J]